MQMQNEKPWKIINFFFFHVFYKLKLFFSLVNIGFNDRFCTSDILVLYVLQNSLVCSIDFPKNKKIVYFAIIGSFSLKIIEKKFQKITHQFAELNF